MAKLSKTFSKRIPIDFMQLTLILPWRNYPKKSFVLSECVMKYLNPINIVWLDISYLQKFDTIYIWFVRLNVPGYSRVMKWVDKLG